MQICFDAECELKHDNPFELTIAVLLSAQCTDNLVNKVTRSLFKNIKLEDYLKVDIEELQNDIKSIGLYRNKAKILKIMPIFTRPVRWTSSSYT